MNKRLHISRTGLPRPRSGALLLGLAAMLASTGAKAQVAGYSTSWSNDSTYASISGGTVLANCTQGGGAVGQFYLPTYLGIGVWVDPVTYPNGQAANGTNQVRQGPGYPIGFNFEFNGDVFDRIGVSEQGWISFGKSSDGAEAVAIFSSTNAHTQYWPLRNQLAPMEGTYKRNRVTAWGTQGGSNQGAGAVLPYIYSDTYPDEPGASLRIQTLGDEGDRVMVVQWSRYYMRNFSSTIGVPTHKRFQDFQIRLYENGNRVEVRFGPSTPSVSYPQSTNHQVGIGGRTGATSASGGADFKGWSGSWASPTLMTNSSTASFAANNSAMPTVGQSFVFAPPPCPQVASGPVLSNVDTSSVTFGWTGSGDFNYVISPTNDPSDVNAVTGSTSGNSVNVTGLTPGTQYWAFVRTDCGLDGTSNWLAPVTFTAIPTVLCGEDFIVSVGGSPRGQGTWVLCPTTPAEVVNVTFNTWLVDNQGSPDNRPSAMYVYDGPNMGSPLISSGAPGRASTSETPQTVLPPGGFWGAIIPAPFTATGPTGCLTFHVNSFWNSSWDADVTCVAPATCFPPTNISSTPSTQGATFTWDGTSPEHDWVIVAQGDGPEDTPILSGTVASLPLVVTDDLLLGSTTYTLYVRGVCDDEDISTWSNQHVFTTLVGCGGPFNLSFPNAFGAVDSVTTICPNDVGDVVTVTSSLYDANSFGGDVTLYAYDGPNTSSPLMNSGQPGLGVFPPGGYHQNNVLPGPFTSTHASGCLTFRARATGTGSYGTTFNSVVACGPPPPCVAPSGVAFSQIGSTEATVSWGGGGSAYIVEYGPAGFTPGTGAAPGTNGILASSSATSPFVLTGLSITSTYDVFVRQVCDGPTYSTNSFRERFSTSMDCSTAQVIACGEPVTATFVAGPGSAVYNTPNYTNASPCLTGAFLQAGASGQERLFRFTAPESGDHQLHIWASSISGGFSEDSRRVGYAIAPVEDGCSASEFTCVGVSGNTGASLGLNSLPAGDYYLIADLGDALSGTQNFSVYCPGAPPCVPAPTFPRNNTSLAASSTTPIPFSWPAAFGATGYDIYFDNALVVSNHPTNSFTDGSYTAALFGVGNQVTWRVEPRNVDGITSCSNWTFRVGGNGPGGAIPITEGETIGGSQKTDSYYSNLWTNGNPPPSGSPSALNGNDATFSFSASACATGVQVSLCVSNVGSPTYNSIYVARASDNTVVGTSSEGNAGCRTLTLAPGTIESGQNYFIVIDTYAAQFDFTVSYTETLDLDTDSDNDGTPDCQDECPNDPDKIVEGICGCFVPDTDTDGDGTPDCIDECPLLFGGIGDPCTPNVLYSSGVINASCECEGVDLAPCTNQVTLELNTGANGEEASWELLHNDGIILSGGGVGSGYPNNGALTEFFCLPDACYTLRVYDAAGDGLMGYVLRMSGVNGDRIVDNVGNFGGSGMSAIGSGPSTICFPMATGPDAPKPLFHLRDKLDFVSGSYLVCEEDPAVSAEWGGPNVSNSGYQFWIFDPNGSYSYRRFRSHANSDGFANVGATRACHMKINNWAVAQQAQPNVLYNVRIRTRVNGVNGNWGPAFRFKIDPARAACPLTKLNDFPGNQFESCGQSRTWGASSMIHARPVSSANRYQWRFRSAEDTVGIVIENNTYFLQLNWTVNPLVEGVTYDVDVRARKNGVWCTTIPAVIANQTYFDQWGDLCQLTISGVQAQGGGQNLAIQSNNANLTMYPNPNRGDQLWLNIDVIEEGVEMITVDFFDLAGHRTVARMIPTQGDRLQTVLDFQGQLAAGVYIVHITAGEKVYTERLVITQ